MADGLDRKAEEGEGAKAPRRHLVRSARTGHLAYLVPFEPCRSAHAAKGYNPPGLRLRHLIGYKILFSSYGLVLFLPAKQFPGLSATISRHPRRAPHVTFLGKMSYLAGGIWANSLFHM